MSNASFFSGAEALDGYVETSDGVVDAEQETAGTDGVQEDAAAAAEPERSARFRLSFGSWFRRHRGSLQAESVPEEDASWDLAIEPDLGDAELEAEVHRPRRARWLLWAGVATVAAVVGVSIGLMAAVSADRPQVPVATSQAPRIAGIPGWSESASWSDTESVSSVVVASDGKHFAALADSSVTIRDQSGTRTSREPVAADTQLLAGVVAEKPALLALTGTQLFVWSGDMVSATTWTVPGQSPRVAVLGAGVVVTTADGQTYVVTDGGLAPYTTPRVGAAALAVTRDGALQWASARGEVLTASATGSIVQQFALIAPAPGATVSRWLAGGDTVMLVWVLPDGSSVLATHSAADGTVLASAPAGAVAAADRLVLSASTTMAMFREFHVDLTTGWIGVPDPTFVASTALGEAFYGASGATAAVLDGDITTLSKQTPTVTPVGTTADGSLVALVQGVVSLLPKTPAN